jgi:site-specific recombinase XerD
LNHVHYLHQFTLQKEKEQQTVLMNQLPDSLNAWMDQYTRLVIAGIRTESSVKKVSLHLDRFLQFFSDFYGHDRISSCLKRDVVAWQHHLLHEDLAHSTINNHIASLSGFTAWVYQQDPMLFSLGNPFQGVGELGLPPLEVRALSEEQIRSLKNICDRLERFHWKKDRRRTKGNSTPKVKTTGRPWRDRAIVFVLLSTGLRREELVNVNLNQVNPHTPDALRSVRKARIEQVKKKGKTERVVYLSADARQALADYLEKERCRDENEVTEALFVSAQGLPARRKNGRLSPQAINTILSKIGQWHDAEISDPERKISPLQPHDLRHSFAFQLAKVTGADPYELERRLGHRSDRYIKIYTNPPEAVAASYVEEL